jgi:hypothetical protein
MQFIDFQITANGSNQALASFAALAGITQAAHIRIEPVRGADS